MADLPKFDRMFHQAVRTRLAALLYDGFLVAAIWMLVGLILQIIFGTDSNRRFGHAVDSDVIGRQRKYRDLGAGFSAITDDGY